MGLIRHIFGVWSDDPEPESIHRHTFRAERTGEFEWYDPQTISDESPRINVPIHEHVELHCMDSECDEMIRGIDMYTTWLYYPDTEEIQLRLDKNWSDYPINTSNHSPQHGITSSYSIDEWDVPPEDAPGPSRSDLNLD